MPESPRRTTMNTAIGMRDFPKLPIAFITLSSKGESHFPEPLPAFPENESYHGDCKEGSDAEASADHQRLDVAVFQCIHRSVQLVELTVAGVFLILSEADFHLGAEPFQSFVGLVNSDEIFREAFRVQHYLSVSEAAEFKSVPFYQAEGHTSDDSADDADNDGYLHDDDDNAAYLAEVVDVFDCLVFHIDYPFIIY